MTSSLNDLQADNKICLPSGRVVLTLFDLYDLEAQMPVELEVVCSAPISRLSL